MRDANGVITVKLAEADDVARTRIRPKMREPFSAISGTGSSDQTSVDEARFRNLM
ncbi:putative zinc-binding metallopeptidase [Burkholderia multivorans]|uniref:putative zinc-binding metallopeptidase n=1 Tax=Burkholderia multivorans TaxID=87883 RepID=UPI0020B2C64D|nr:putative zinc-binding metallopeptidase [Burkholderia multivorans]